MRNDKPTEFRQDLGAAKDFQGIDQFRIPGGAIDDSGVIYIEETVGSLIEIANQMRGKPSFDKRELVQVQNINY